MPVSSGTPRISVALCTHNGGRWIAQQVRSIVGQSVPPHEIVVSDDASSDDTIVQIEREVAGSGIELRVLRNDVPLRVTANFAQALAATTGQLVALCDQDDVWEPDRVERAVAIFDARPEVDLVFGDARIIDGAGQPTGATLFDELGLRDSERAEIGRGRAIDVLLRRSVVTGATAMVRRELIDRALPFSEPWVHDEWLAIVAALTGDIAIAPGVLVSYRIHGGNQIGMARLTAATVRQRLTASRAPRNARMLAVAECTAERLDGWGDLVSPADAALVRQKAQHERFRSGLPAARWRRIGPVLTQARAGNYARFSRGAPDVLRDLVQPV